MGASPAQLVTALYRGAIDGAVTAQRCLETGDIMGRSKAVTKVVNILTELMLALDHQQGGDIAANLKKLYSYMQQRALAAHIEKRAEPMAEVEKLLRNMIEAWYKVAESAGQPGQQVVAEELKAPESPSYEPAPAEVGVYGSSYGSEVEARPGTVYSF